MIGIPRSNCYNKVCADGASNRPSNRLLKTTTFNRTLTDKKKNHNIHNMMIIFFYLIIDGRIFYDR